MDRPPSGSGGRSTLLTGVIRELTEKDRPTGILEFGGDPWVAGNVVDCAGRPAWCLRVHLLGHLGVEGRSPVVLDGRWGGVRCSPPPPPPCVGRAV